MGVRKKRSDIELTVNHYMMYTKLNFQLEIIVTIYGKGVTA